MFATIRRLPPVVVGLLVLWPPASFASQVDIVAKLTEPGSWFCTSTRPLGSFIRRQFKKEGAIAVEYYNFRRFWENRSPLQERPSAQGTWRLLDNETLETIVGPDRTVLKVKDDEGSIYASDVSDNRGYRRQRLCSTPDTIFASEAAPPSASPVAETLLTSHRWYIRKIHGDEHLARMWYFNSSGAVAVTDYILNDDRSVLRHTVSVAGNWSLEASGTILRIHLEPYSNLVKIVRSLTDSDGSVVLTLDGISRICDDGPKFDK